jgi:hypothetical protein
MNSMIRTRLMSSALVAAGLVGCNAVEDVREEPFTPVPTATVVLQGKVTGPLGNLRAVTLLNNGDDTRAIGVTASLGTDYTVFTFGSVPVGSPYNITVKNNPFGKVCTVTGGTGVITTAEALKDKIIVNCVNNPAVPRYNLRTVIPSTFGSLEGAKVVLSTEEGRYVIENPDNTPADPDRVGTIAPGATSVTFSSVLFNNVVGGTVWGASSPGATAVTSTANGGINPYTNIVGGVVNGATFAWRVTATNTAGSTPDKPQVNNCVMTASSNFAASASGSPGTPNFGTAVMPPVGNIGFGTVTSQIPTVGACTFTIGGTVSYNTPSGGTPQTMPAGGLDLQLRDVQGNVIETLTYTAGYGASGTSATGAGAPYTFINAQPSSSNSVYDVAVSRHPANQYCVVANGGQATLGLAAANITNVNVACRAKPTGTVNNAILKGAYLFLNGETYNYPSPSPAATSTSVTATAADGTTTVTTTAVTTLNTRTTYNSNFAGAIPPATEGGTPNPVGESWGQTVVSNLSTRTTVVVTPPGGTATTTSDTTALSTTTTTNNNVTRNFLTFFEDGTFLHGVHSQTLTSALNQIEHGFYLYDTTTATIRLTLVTDTNTTNLATVTGAAVQSNSLLTMGLSGTGGTATVNGSPTAIMTNVVKGTLNGRPTIAGRFALVGGATAYGTTVAGSRWATWNMIEPKNTDGLMEGPFASQDHRRFWVYDDNPKLGFHVGVNGGAANLQDGCFTVENSLAVSGFLTRRSGTAITCLGNVVQLDIPQGVTSLTPTPIRTPVALESLPGFVGRIPGGKSTIVDGRPPSPTYYVIARADQFATVAGADPVVTPFFPPDEITPAALNWCLNSAGTGPGEVYGVRSSQNGVPIDKAVYFCRYRAN